ncbi:MAG TPA: flagellar hook-associated protein FlgL [Pirellulales bacterium]|nr:flagellar hook-associated protein FlgL [Pirellulales bacterium]
MSIIPVPATRVSDSYVRERLTQQVEDDQVALFKLQNELSTGSRLNEPSDDPSAAMLAVGLQSLLAQNQQYQSNLQVNSAYLSASDSALTQVNSLINTAQGLAVGATGSTATDSQRQAAATQLQDLISQMLSLANTQFSGRYLFAGSLTTTQPFSQTSTGVVYQGDQKTISSYGNTADLFATNITGDSAFGGFSQSMQGTADLNPVLSVNTPLADLNGGQGVTPGSIQVSDGTHVSVIDLSSASTVGDVAKLIEANPPTGRTVTVQVTNTGLTVQLDSAGGGSLSVSEVGGGTEAAQLGIKDSLFGSTGPIVGTDLNPRLTTTTPIANILGTRASVDIAAIGANNNVVVQANANGTADNGVKVVYVNDAWYQAAPGISAGSEFATYNTAATPAKASLHFTGPDNDLILTANTPGAAFNNVTVNVVSGGAMGNAANASYNAGTKTLTLTVDNTGATSTGALITAINADGTFTAARDSSAEPNPGGGFISPVDIHNGMGDTYLTGGDPNTIQVHIQSGQSNANGVITAINALGGFTASLDPSEYGNSGTGLVTDAETDPGATGTLAGGSGVALDQTSGIQIVNGGKTYNVTFGGATTVQDVLNDINGSGASVFAQINQAQNGINIQSRLSGSDFSIGENGGQTATQLGVRTFNVNTSLADLNYGAGVRHSTGGDFTITRKDGVQFTVDISSAKTIGDVLNLINTNATNTGSGIPVVAQLDTTGNGIELVDNDPGTTPLSVTAVTSSLAAQDLGLLAVGATASAAPTPGVQASATVAGAGANNDLIFTAKNSSTAYNGVKVQFTTGAPLGGETVAYNAGAKTLTFNVNAATTANRVIAVLAADPTAGPLFSAALTPTDGGAPNDGTGVIDTTATGTLAGGTAETLSGTDTNPQEVDGVFNALLRLQTALQNNDLSGIERANSLLGTAQQNLSLARAQLGANEQAVSGLQSTVNTANTQLQSSLSNQTDADMAQVISDFVAKQTAYQAALQSTGLISKLTLLDYL